MYKIATTHPVGMRRFPTRAYAVEIARTWGLGSWRVHLDLTHPGRGVQRVPAAR